MAEDELIKKHAQNALDAMTHPGKKWTHKLKDILQEILIIVFAVSVSIWLHGWSEDRKDRREEKEFFAGLKQDIEADLTEMENDRAALRLVQQHCMYYGMVGKGRPFQIDSVMNYAYIFFTQAQINPRISRFEALKGSGRLDIIEDKKLLYNIIDLYQKIFPTIYRYNQSFNELNSNKIDPYLGDMLQIDTSGNFLNSIDILKTSRMRLLLNQLYSNAATCEGAYTKGIEKSKEILAGMKESH
ncbi:MAG: hypothetical protein KGO82_00055 [Bacteroidota bacterium]|nr:hypothetical protein [Bacteroidota bacterium]